MHLYQCLGHLLSHHYITFTAFSTVPVRDQDKSILLFFSYFSFWHSFILTYYVQSFTQSFNILLKVQLYSQLLNSDIMHIIFLICIYTPWAAISQTDQATSTKLAVLFEYIDFFNLSDNKNMLLIMATLHFNILFCYIPFEAQLHCK